MTLDKILWGQGMAAKQWRILNADPKWLQLGPDKDKHILDFDFAYLLDVAKAEDTVRDLEQHNVNKLTHVLYFIKSKSTFHCGLCTKMS